MNYPPLRRKLESETALLVLEAKQNYKETALGLSLLFKTFTKTLPGTDPRQEYLYFI